MASLAGVPLLESAVVRARIEALARRRGRPLTAESARQAWLPQGIETLHNPVGLAPGLWLPLGPSIVCALPGVPGELEAMLEQEVVPRLVAWPGRVELESHTLRTMGVPESELARVLAGVDLGGVTIAYLPGAGGVDLRLDARGSGARRRCAAAAAAVRSMLTETLGPVNYATGARRLAAVVLDGLRARGWRLALAESCSGGLIASLLTDEPGSSDVLDASVVTYSNAAKCELLGVPAELVETHGAVSDEVTAAMAVGARRRLGADVGLAVSGIAGPGGGTPEKPVGRVHIAVDGPAGAAGRRLDLGGTRDMVRRRAANLALDLLRRYAEGQVDPGARRG
jgi:nicotinamide-nucleotide amidase